MPNQPCVRANARKRRGSEWSAPKSATSCIRATFWKSSIATRRSLIRPLRSSPTAIVSLEIGGDLKVGGRNLEQVRAGLLAKARTRLAAPELTIILKEFQKPYVVVAGEVRSLASLKCAKN